MHEYLVLPFSQVSYFRDWRLGEALPNGLNASFVLEDDDVESRSAKGGQGPVEALTVERKDRRNNWNCARAQSEFYSRASMANRFSDSKGSIA